MLAALMIGLVGGQRAMTPLAAVSVAAAAGALPADNGAPRIIAHRLFAAAAIALAAAELAGDKMKMAPARVVLVGLAARLVTSAVAGAAMVPLRQRWLGAAVGGSSAIAASFPGWRARTAAIPRHGRVTTGVIEDAIVILAATLVTRTHNASAAGASSNRRR